MKRFDLWKNNLDRRLSQRIWIACLRLIAAVGRDVQGGQLRLHAAALSYITLLSFVPMLALSFSVLKSFGAGDEMRPFLLHLLQPLGDQAEPVVERISAFVSNMQVGVLGAIGLSLLLYSVVALMQEIEFAFNDIWRVEGRRPFLLRVRDYLSVLMIGPVLMFIAVALPAALRHADLPWPAALTFAADAAAWLLFSAAFAAIYMFMPYTRVKPLPACVAGIMTGLMWKTLGWLFGLFVSSSASYAAIYTAFAALVLFMIWVNIGWLTVLIGASVCYYLQNPSNQRLRRGAILSIRMQEKIALALCAEIGRAFYTSLPPLNLTTLAERLALPVRAVSDVLNLLIETGFIAATGKSERVFIPARPFDTTQANDMLQALRAVGEEFGACATVLPHKGLTLKQLSQGEPAA